MRQCVTLAALHGDGGRVGDDGGGQDTEKMRKREREGCDSVLLCLVSMKMEEEKEMTKVDEIQKDKKTRQ